MKKLVSFLAMSAITAAGAQVQTNDSVIVNDTVNAVLLNEIEVKTTGPTQRLSKGGLVTEVRNTPLGDVGTCKDVIAQLPGVRIDDDNIEIIGRGTPQIYINGRKMQDRSELDRLSSKVIRNIEVLYNPGAKYGAETKSVILIKTIPGRGEGLSGSEQINVRQGRYFSLADNLSLNYRNGGVDVFGSFYYDRSARFQKQWNNTEIRTATESYQIDSDLKLYPKSTSYTADFGVNWQINSNHYLGVKYEYEATPDSKSHWFAEENVMANGVKEGDLTRETVWNRWTAPVHLVNQYYQGKIRSLGITINNDYYFRRSGNEQSIFEKSTVSDERRIESDDRIRSCMFASKGTADYTFNAGTLEFGYEVTSTQRRDRFVNQWDELPDADDEIRELTAAAFVAVNIPVKAVELYAGLRYEHTASDYYQQGKFVDEQSRRYGRLYPSLDFTFPIKRAKFTLSYEAKTKRPLYSQLSSSVQYDDRFTYETGNPLLKSEQMHNISLAGIYRWMFFSAMYTYDRDAIISVIRPYEAGAPQSIMTYENCRHLSKYNIVLSLSPRISKWSPRLRLNLMGQRFSMETTNSLKKQNNPVLFFNLFNSIALGGGFMLNADVSGRTRGDMDVVTLKPSWQVNLGVSKSMSGWFLQFQATDIFRTARNSMITYGTQMTLDKWNYSDTQALRLIARYSFNVANSKYKGKGAGVTERNRLL